jgi:NitT/TauT family transport system ATP-binding protein
MTTPAPAPPSFGTAVALRGVRRVFDGDVVAVESLDLDVPAGEFLAILGPSGCGKSTLLRMIAGLDRATNGEVILSASADERTADAERTNVAQRGPTRIAYVFQDAHLLPWRDVVDNVALPLELIGTSRAKRREAAAEAIARVGLADAARRDPAQLSGGMRMRVSLARALVTDPELLLLDEPFAALDEITRQQLDDQLHRLWSARRMTTIFVTHSILEATFLAQRAVVFSRRPARVVLDRVLDLPARRHAQLRTDPQFAREMGVLFEALDLEALDRGGLAAG